MQQITSEQIHNKTITGEQLQGRAFIRHGKRGFLCYEVLGPSLNVGQVFVKIVYASPNYEHPYELWPNLRTNVGGVDEFIKSCVVQYLDLNPPVESLSQKQQVGLLNNKLYDSFS